MARTLTVRIYGSQLSRQFRFDDSTRFLGETIGFFAYHASRKLITGYEYTVMLDGAAVGKFREKDGKEMVLSLSISNGPHRVWIRLRGKDYPPLDIPAGAFSCTVTAMDTSGWEHDESVIVDYLRPRPVDGDFPFDFDSSDTTPELVRRFREVFSPDGDVCRRRGGYQDVCECCVVRVMSEMVQVEFFRSAPKPAFDQPLPPGMRILKVTWNERDTSFFDYMEARDLCVKLRYADLARPGGRLPFGSLNGADCARLRDRLKGALSGCSHLTLQDLAAQSTTEFQVINDLRDNGIRRSSSALLSAYAVTFH